MSVNVETVQSGSGFKSEAVIIGDRSVLIRTSRVDDPDHQVKSEIARDLEEAYQKVGRNRLLANGAAAATWLLGLIGGGVLAEQVFNRGKIIDSNLLIVAGSFGLAYLAHDKGEELMQKYESQHSALDRLYEGLLAGSRQLRG